MLSHIQEVRVSLFLKHTKNRSRKRMTTEEIRGGVPRRQHARLNDKLNGDELRIDDENKKMEHNAAGLWRIGKKSECANTRQC